MCTGHENYTQFAVHHFVGYRAHKENIIKISLNNLQQRLNYCAAY